MEQMNSFLRTYVTTSSQFFDAHKKHPAVELLKVTLSVALLRADIDRTSSSSTSSPNFARRHPFAAWFSSFLAAYSGSILACILMAESPLKPLCNPSCLLYVTAAWYAVFYSPFDICYRLSGTFPLNSILLLCSELYRVGNIQSGVKYAMRSSLAKEVKLKPALMIIVGGVKGCGGSLMRGVVRLVRSASLRHQRRGSSSGGGSSGGDGANIYSVVDNEFQTPTFFSKVSFLAAGLFTAYWLSLIPPQFDYAVINVAIHFFFISQRLMMALTPDPRQADPLATIESFICLLLLGKEAPAAAAAAATATTAGDGDGEEEEEEGEEQGKTKRRTKKEN